MATYHQISAPASEPLTLAEAKAHLRILTAETYDDTYITALITAARNVVENKTWRSLISQQWSLNLDYSELNKFARYATANFSTPDAQIIELEKCPIISVDSITYYDVNNTLQTLAISAYQVDLLREPARVILNLPPVCYNKLNTFTINFTAGYSTVPETIKSAMKIIISDMYTFRETVVLSRITELPAIENLLNYYKLDWHVPQY